MMENRAVNFLENSFLSDIISCEGVTDVSYNGESLFYMDNVRGRRKLGLEVSREEVIDFLRQIANLTEEKWNYSDPILDVSFGPYRLNAVFHSLSRLKNEKSVTFSLRLQSPVCRLLDDKAFFPKKSRDLLRKALKEGESIVIGGKTGTGKTELQKWLLLNMPEATRVIAIDDVEELGMLDYKDLDFSMWVYGEGRSSPERLVKNALRNNPDYIVLAECRGREAYDAITSAMTGHPIITTLHAKSLEEMPRRLSNMALRVHEGLSEKELQDVVMENMGLYVYLGKTVTERGVKRKIVSIGRKGKGNRLEKII